MSSVVATAPGSQTGRRSQVESFFRTLILGDFEDHPNTPAEIIGGLISLIPILDQVMDVRDIAACLYKINHQGGFKNATPDQVVNLGFAAIGAIPEIGSVFKTVFKPLWRERRLAKGAVNGGVQAIEAMLGMKQGGAIRWIREELLGKWAARTQQAIAQVNLAMDSCIALLDFVANASGWKAWLIPDSVQQLARGLLPGMKDMRSGIHDTMNRASAEIEMFLKDLLGEQAARIVMNAGERAIAASATPGARSNQHHAHNAAAVAPKGGELPRQGRHKTQAKDTVDTGRGAGSSHKAVQRTRQVFGTMAHIATGLVGEHMVDYHELKRLGGSFPHDSSHRFPTGASVAKINADKRPVNLSIEDLPKVPYKGIDAVWQHGSAFTVTEAKARGSLVVLEAVAAKKAPKELKSLDDKILYLLLSTSAAEEGDGKTLIQMSPEWVQDRVSAEKVPDHAEVAIRASLCDRRVVLVTFESAGAVPHAQALSELELGVPIGETLAHSEHGTQKTWMKQDIDRLARVKLARKQVRDQRRDPATPTKGVKGSKGS
ncbi:hypothetical protein [Aquabacterium sp.]|uniref:hypothetical protein n=1 Tax=Aquabacterium sp. TaxID=1872578 RepID=UPI003783E0CB